MSAPIEHYLQQAGLSDGEILKRLSPDGICIIAMDGRFLEVNDAYCTLLGYTRDELLAMRIGDLEVTPGGSGLAQCLERAVASGREHVVAVQRRKDGTAAQFEMTMQFVERDGAGIFVVLCRDIGRLMRARSRIDDQSRLLAVASEIGQALVRSRDAGALLAEACRILVRAGGFSGARIGRATTDGSDLQTLAQAGEQAPDIGAGDMPAVQALRSGAAVIVDDTASEARFSAWCRAARAAGIHSTAAFPVRGLQLVLAVYGARKGAFDEEVRGLLARLAADLEYRIQMLRDASAHARAQAALHEVEARLRTVVTHAPLVLWAIDRDGRFTLSEGKALEGLGLGPGEVVGHSVYEVYKDVPHVLAEVRRVLAGEEFVSYVAVGERIYEAHYSPLCDENGEISGAIGVATDDTERLQTQAELARKQAEFQAIFNSLADAILYTNAQREIVMVNPAAERVFGYVPDELLGKTTEFLYAEPADYRSQGQARYHPGASLNKPVYEMTYRRKDGSVFVGETLGTRVSDANGNTLGFIGIVRDVTARKVAERALRESEARWRSITEHSPDHIWMVDRGGRILFINRTVPELTVEEVVGASIYDLVDRDFHDAMRNCFARVFATGQPDQFDIDFPTPEGNRRIFETRAGPMLNEAGEVVAITLGSRDITDRIRVENELRASGKELGAILNSMQDTFVRTDADGRVVRVSDSVRSLLGYEVNELLGMWLADLYVEPAGHELFLKELAANGGSIASYEVALRRSDGSSVWVSINGQYYRDEQGEIAGIEGTVRDITEARRNTALRVRFGNILENSSNEIYVFDARTLRFTQVNRGALLNTGYSEKELRQLTPVDLKPDFTREGFELLLEPLHKGTRRQVVLETRYQRKDGSMYPVEVRMQLSAEETPPVFLAIVQDISERKRAEAQTRKLSSALEQTADSVVITDRDGNIEYVNPAFEATTGYRRAEVVGKKPNIIKSDRHDEDFYAKMWEIILSGEVYRDVLINKRKDGSLYYEEKTITPLRDANGVISNFISTAKDISERMQNQERLQYLAHHDVLTGLPNRALFTDRLDHALQRRRSHERSVAVLFLDLDRFKIINDTLGHDVGDRTLQALSERLLGCVREGDTVARLGGDEFAIILEDIAVVDEVVPVARKVLEVLGPAFMVDSQELFVTTSIGISVGPDDGEDSQTLLRHADIAMYRAKEQGRNTYQFYSADMGARAFQRLNLETNLRHALERDEFVLHYQPQVDIRTGRVLGVEALLRWMHPALGMVAPADFIPLLEETGIIFPVGDWVLQHACEQARRWEEAGYGSLRMAVNLSSRQFSRPGIVATVSDALERNGLKAGRLEIEMTEGVIIRHTPATMQTFQGLSDLGVRLAIDDFGTEYSSLSYLKRFPIDTLKIDRTFIRDINTDPDDAAIVEAILAMANSLKLEVIAEGVETEQQLEFLRAQGCDVMQGYVYDGPRPAAELKYQQHW